MKVDIAIMTVREDEFMAVRRRFKTERRRIPDGRTYLIGEVKTEKQTYTIAIKRCIEQANDVSQRLAHQMIHDLDPRLILVVGIAGGVPHDEFTLGDVVVSTRIVNPNIDAWHPDGTTDYSTRGGPPHPLVEDIVSLLPDEPQLADWTGAIQLERPTLDSEQANLTGPEEWREKVRQSLKRHFGEEHNRGRLPTFTIGSILSSNHLMKDPLRLKEILKTHRSILAVEMEVAGVYEAAQVIDHQYPVLAIRGISDIVGLQRDSRWTEYACQAAAAFTYALIMTDPLDPLLNSASFQRPVVPSEISSAQLRGSEPSLDTQHSVRHPRPVLVKSTTPINICCCYAREDEFFLNQIKAHLSPLLQENLIQIWHDREIRPGKELAQEIKKSLDTAQIILLLLSSDFFASEYCYNIEMKRAIERHEADKARVIPVILRPCNWEKSPLRKFLALPRDGKAIILWPNWDEAFYDVAEGIQKVVEELTDLNSQKSRRRRAGEGSVYYHKRRNRWYAALPPEGGKRKTYPFKTREEAVKKLKPYERQDQTETVEQFLNRWLRSIQSKMQYRSYQRYEQYVRHIIPIIGQYQIQQLRPQHVQTLCADGGLRSILHLALNDAVRRGFITHNICDEIPPPKQTNREIPLLTRDQIKELIRTAKGHPLKTLIILAVTTDMRRGELLALRWHDIDFTQNELRITHTLIHEREENSTRRELRPKKKTRNIRLAPLVIQALKQPHLRQQAVKMQAGTKWQERDLVFCTPLGEPLFEGKLSAKLGMLLAKAKLPKVNLDDLRFSAVKIRQDMVSFPEAFREWLEIIEDE